MGDDTTMEVRGLCSFRREEEMERERSMLTTRFDPKETNLET